MSPLDIDSIRFMDTAIGGTIYGNISPVFDCDRHGLYYRDVELHGRWLNVSRMTSDAY